MRKLLLLILILIPLASCEDPPTAPTVPGSGSVFRTWRIEGLANDAQFDRLLESDSREGGDVHAFQLLGPMSINPQGTFPEAVGQVFSNETGSTYWASVEAPTSTAGLSAPDSLVGGEVVLRQLWRYRKDDPDGSLRMIITETILEGRDGNGAGVNFDNCPWWVGGPVAQFPSECAELIKGEVESSFYAYADPVTRAEPVDVFYYAGGTALLFGFADRWGVDAYADAGSLSPMFTEAVFDNDFNLDGFHRHARSRLVEPIVIDIPLDSVAQGEEFEVVAFVRVRAVSRRQFESYISAYFRDPVAGDGLEIDTDGLTLLDPPNVIPELRWTPPQPQCTGTMGVIAFDTSAYMHPEWPGDRARIAVTRSGGTGAASAVFSTGGGTATAGSDYTNVATVVRFEDGEDGRRVAYVPILADTLTEQNETVMLSLASPACATLGLSSADLTILDDDADHEPDVVTLGGTVTGLEGTGLRLRNAGEAVDIAANGPFVFPGEYLSGVDYNVSVEQQPNNPLQACTVTNGVGTFGVGDVTDVVITCLTPSGSGLDTGFGTNGIVHVDIVPYSDNRFAAAVALQPDGRILVAGTGDLARYNADGTLDTTFGSSGIVPIEFVTSQDQVFDVAVQPDGRILIAGSALDLVNLPANDNFAVARLEADGTFDTSFGDDGVATVDFGGRPDAAYDILIQPDSAIVLVGAAHTVDPFGAADADFGLARLTSDGALDTTFGTNGATAIDIAGRSDGAHAAALMSDGRIVVTGRAAASGGSDPNIAVVRLDAVGVPDSTFGSAGVVWNPTATFEWAVGIAVDASGRVLVSGHTSSGAFIARYDIDGALDTSFGGGLLDFPDLSNANSLALDDNGRIIVAGAAAGNDFGAIRLNDSGTIDQSFGTSGIIAVDFFNGSDHASDVVIQPDGRIVIVGRTSNGLIRRVGLVRVLP